jgi:solute carrier family 25 uncoupling protein 27
VYTASRICLYEDIRDALAASSGGGGGDGKTTGFGIKLVAGFTAGGVAQLIASPADLIKVRLQTGGAKYSGALDAGRTIYRHEGVAGFWHGWRPNVTRAALVCHPSVTANLSTSVQPQT